MNSQNSDLKLIIDKFSKSTGLNCELLNQNQVQIKSADKSLKFSFSFQKKIKQDSLNTITYYLEQLPAPRLIISDYINSTIASKLKIADISFIDLAGNYYMNKPLILIDVQGKRLSKSQGNAYSAMFKPAGLKIVFVILVNCDFINLPHRKIAELAGVSLGMVGRVINSMQENGFLIQKDKKTKLLINKNKLLEQWVIYYQNNLKPKLLLKRYSSPSANWWKNVKLMKNQTHWSGEIAANILTKHIKPATATIYLQDNLGKFVISNKLKEDNNGNVEILKPFWGGSLLNREAKTVPAILIYADLLTSTNARSQETAKIIYEQEIAKHLK